MSVKATDRAWESPASGTDLLVLLALADFAGGQDDPYDFAYPAVSTLMSMTKLSRRTVQMALRRLEDDGVIRQTGVHNWGGGKATNQYRIEGGASGAPRASEDTKGAHPGAPNPSIDPPNPNRAGAKAKAAEAAQAVPDGFPDELRPHAREVFKILRGIAEQHGAREVTPRAVGLVVMSHRNHALVKEAYALASWCADRNGIKDVVARYRTWLGNASAMAGIERLDENGLPAAAGPRGVVGGRGGRGGMDQAMANHAEIQRLREAGEID